MGTLLEVIRLLLEAIVIVLETYFRFGFPNECAVRFGFPNKCVLLETASQLMLFVVRGENTVLFCFRN